MKLQPEHKMNFLAQQFSGAFTYLHAVLLFLYLLMVYGCYLANYSGNGRTVRMERAGKRDLFFFYI